MRFFATVAALALAASVSAQNSTSAPSSASSTTASLSPQQTCLAKCESSDICCQAACVNVPCPSQLQANATTECAGHCVQGNGSYSETQQYAACQASCVSSYFLSSTTAAAAATGSSGSATFGATATSSGARSSGTGSSSGTQSGSASSASSTGNSAPETRAAIAGAGLLGLIIAGLAL
ncbi:hypothetical protein H2198_002183 [Neophaeococcomyces mojaviensis]|uniref:Uncharacterized protein n=1 Tax=Neophaeococcomyces mojaviensis TaxID=3383035 RepID=A0ACC3AFA8_9EURO|nr:hypothetical protein H2198_002183 [Knufia sp. JES_112]